MLKPIELLPLLILFAVSIANCSRKADSEPDKDEEVASVGTPANTVTSTPKTTETAIPIISDVTIETSSPNTTLTPTVGFTLSKDSIVTLYEDSECSGAEISDAVAKTAGSNTITTKSLGADKSTTIYAKAIDSSNNASTCTKIGTFVTITSSTASTSPTPNPSFSLSPGIYNSTQSVALTSTGSDSIYYTTNGSTPACPASGTLYTSAISISVSTSIKAIACHGTKGSSAVVNATYTLIGITPVAIAPFPDTTNYPAVSWTPKVAFDIASSGMVGLFSDTAGTAINTPASSNSGRNKLSADEVTTAGATSSIYAQTSGSENIVNMGSYTTTLPASFTQLNFTSATVQGVATTAIRALAVDHVSSGCSNATPCLYVGGDFTTAGGVTVNNIAKYKTADGTWTALGTGTNSTVYALTFDSTRRVLYAAGRFSSAGGLTTASRVAKWDPAAASGAGSWSALGEGLAGFNADPNNANATMAFAVANDSAGNLYVGGYFTQAKNPGIVTTDYIAKWTESSSTWSAVGSGVDAEVYTIAIDQVSSGCTGADACLYAGGWFSSASGVATTSYLAKWSPAANSGAGGWTAVGTGVDDTVMTLLVDNDGNLYAGGYFISAGSVSAANKIAKWNGAVWSALGSGVTSTVGSTPVRSIAIDSSGNLFVGGEFTSAYNTGSSAVAGTSYLTKWDGSSWSSLTSGVNSFVRSVIVDNDANVFLCGNFSTANSKGRPALVRWMTLFDDFY